MQPAPYDPNQQPQPYGPPAPPQQFAQQPYQPGPYQPVGQPPAAAPPQQQVVNVYAGGVAPGHYRRRGLSGGAHVMHGLITLCTAGLWFPVWIVHSWSARRR